MEQHKPTIVDYLYHTCLITIDEFNEMYGDYSTDKLKKIADEKFTENDIKIKIGSHLGASVHYEVNNYDNPIKRTNDICVEAKKFTIEVKYPKNWKCNSDTLSATKTWKEYQQDFDWLIREIRLGHKHYRAFVIGWFNCVTSLSQYLQLGAGKGSKPLINEERVAYFPFLLKTNYPTHTADLEYDYNCSYKQIPVHIIGDRTDINCMFIGNENDCFHFAIYY